MRCSYKTKRRYKMETIKLTTLEKETLINIMRLDAKFGDGTYGTWEQDYLMGVYFNDLVKETELKANTIKGVVGSLAKKGLINIYEDDGVLTYFPSQNPYPSIKDEVA